MSATEQPPVVIDVESEGNLPNPKPQAKPGSRRRTSVQAAITFLKTNAAQARTQNTEVGIDLVFTKCSYEVSVKKGTLLAGTEKRLLLNNVSAFVKAGHVLAIMGPSGAGKTTLLNLLTLEDGGGKPSGNITLNGHPLTSTLYKHHCAYVRQTDSLWPFMTPREHITRAVQLYDGVTGRKTANERVEFLIKSMGLTSCQHTRVGGVMTKGISGGQKRRLSLAIAMAKKPSVLFLDEPTSGLDASAAASIMDFLNVYAAEMKIAIVCTIHQPSAAVFAGFGDMLVLAEGRLAYFGPAAELEDHILKIGHTTHGANPAEVMLTLINRDFTSDAEVDATLAAGMKSEATLPDVGKGRKMTSLPVDSSTTTSATGQTITLTGCAWSQGVRSPIQYTGRMISMAVGSIFYAVNYFASREATQEQVVSRVFFIMWATVFPCVFGIVATYVQWADFLAVRREIKDGMYKPLSYLVAQILIDAPMMCMMAIFALIPGVYLINDVPWESFGTVFIVQALVLLVFETGAQFFALLYDKSVLVGLILFLGAFFGAFFYNGFLLRQSDCSWPFKLFFYFSPLRWSTPMTAHAVFMELTFNGTAPCEISTLCSRGFYCPSDPVGFACWGETGEQVITSLHELYPTVNPDIDYGQGFGLLAGYVCFNKLLHLLLFLHKCRGFKLPASANA